MMGRVQSRAGESGAHVRESIYNDAEKMLESVGVRSKHVFIFLAFLSASIFPIARANSQTPKGLEVGQVIGNESGQVINGWTDLGGGFFSPPPHRATSDMKSPSGYECCYTLFTRDDDYALAITVPVAKNVTGGVIAEKITAIKFLKLSDSEEQVWCDPLWLKAVFSSRKTGTNLVRSWLFDGTDFQGLTWMDDDGRCDGP
jgi:hypothetical protein